MSFPRGHSPQITRIYFPAVGVIAPSKMTLWRTRRLLGMETESYPFCFILRRRYLAGFLCQGIVKGRCRLSGHKSTLAQMGFYRMANSPPSGNAEGSRSPAGLAAYAARFKSNCITLMISFVSSVRRISLSKK